MTTKMTMTTMGLKSNVPMVGNTRRMGPRIGSVNWFTSALIFNKIGWGLAPAMGITKDRIARATMAKIKRLRIVLISPLKSPHPWPNAIDFR